MNLAQCARLLRSALDEAHPTLHLLDGGVPIHLGDCSRERNALWTNLDAVLGVATVGDSSFTGQNIESIRLKSLSDGVKIEEDGLADGGGADEVGFLADLRAGLHTTSAGHAARKRIAELPNVVILRLSHAEIIRTVDGDPGLELDKILKHLRSIHAKIADDRELAHWLQVNFDHIAVHDSDIVYECGASLSDIAVHVHRARPADFFETCRIPDRRRNLLTRGRDWILLHFLQRRNDVHPVSIGNIKNILTNGAILAGLPGDGESNCFGHSQT